MQLNIEQIIAEFGKKYIHGGQTEKDIKAKLFAQDQTSQFFRKVPTESDVYRKAYATQTQVLQAFQTGFTPKGTTTFLPSEFALGELKVDDTFVPDEFRASWLGFLADIAKEDRTKWPILNWYIQNMIIPQQIEDYETEVAFYGWGKTAIVDANPVLNAATGERHILKGQASPANAAGDGIRRYLQRYKDRTLNISTGALSDDAVTFATQVEEFVKEIPTLLRKKLDFIFIEPDRVNLYMDGVREKYNGYYKQEADLTGIKNSTLKVQGLDSMVGSSKMFASIAANRVQPIHTGFSGRFDVQKDGRAINLLSDYKKGIGFEVPEYVVQNDLELTITAEELAGRYAN